MRHHALVLILFAIPNPARAADKPTTAPTTKPTPQTSGFFNLAHAPSIIFVCESSGSMGTKWDLLHSALHRAAAALETGQTYNVVFLGPDGCDPLANQLLNPTRANLTRLDDFIAKAGGRGGGTEPLPALKFALQLKPALIFLITDGDFPNNAEVLDLLRTTNKDKKTRINTIAFIDHDENYEKFLKEIAQENDGTYHFAEGKDFDLEK